MNSQQFLEVHLYELFKLTQRISECQPLKSQETELYHWLQTDLYFASGKRLSKQKIFTFYHKDQQTLGLQVKKKNLRIVSFITVVAWLAQKIIPTWLESQIIC